MKKRPLNSGEWEQARKEMQLMEQHALSLKANC